MSINKYLPHIFVLPEDEANRELMNGFLTLSDVTLDVRRIQILTPVGGWGVVVSEFETIHQKEMLRYPERYLVLLLDFDENENRRQVVSEKIPADLKDRVFVVGVWSEPQKLQASTGKTREDIGRTLAAECRYGELELWNHEMLEHNKEELVRMQKILKPILFPVQ